MRQFFEKFKAPDEMSPEEIEQLFIEKLDYLVNADTKETFFGIMGPFSPCLLYTSRRIRISRSR